ncbi:MAG: PHP domain-containing protein, partial [Clostridia bacterium]|nr:PHP domain-containing protein [Clostridia bacterium]
AYMPSRNTLPQLRRIMTMADEYGFMQISGEDINQPRQSFICEQLSDPIFAHLTDTTWALVGHEISATQDINNGIFADEKKLREEGLSRLISVFKQIGLSGTGT